MDTQSRVAAVSAYEANLSYCKAKEPVLIAWAGDETILLDRFDALHLLYGLPDYEKITENGSSDAEDDEGFDFSGDELHTLLQAKRRKQLATLRSERMATKATRERDQGSLRKRPLEPTAATTTAQQIAQDEKPSAAIEQLMQHTAKALLSSPDPALLEMRIMTNHAQDERFAFLRGKWPTTWSRFHKRPAAAPLPKPAGLHLGLGYGSSDEEGDRTPPPPSSPPPDPDQVQRLRRERAGVWAESRKRRAGDIQDCNE